MRRALGAVAATIVGMYWLVTFKATPEPAQLAAAATSAPGSRTSATGTPTRGGATATPAATGAAGSFTGSTVRTIFGDVQVRASVTGGKLVDVQALTLPSDRSRSARISQYAGPILRSEALQAQSATIDIISGATYTSIAYGRSLESALQQAHLR